MSQCDRIVASRVHPQIPVTCGEPTRGDMSYRQTDNDWRICCDGCDRDLGAAPDNVARQLWGEREAGVPIAQRGDAA